jgi:hypothetical protein
MNDLTLPGHVDGRGPSQQLTSRIPPGLDNMCPLPPTLSAPCSTSINFCNDSYKKNGFIHYTTARDLATDLEHGFQDPLFRQVVVGFPARPTASRRFLGGGQKQYSLGSGVGAYPGSEGGKGGSSGACGSGSNSPYNLNCSISSAKRIGRRLVLGLIGASYPTTQDDPTLALDYFVLRPVPSRPPRHGRCWQRWTRPRPGLPPRRPRGRRPPWRPTTWRDPDDLGVDVDGSTIAKLAASAPQGASNSQALFNSGVQAYTLVITPSSRLPTTGNPSLNNPKPGASIKLSLWNVAPNGTPGLVVEDVPAGVGASARLLPIDGSQFLLAYVDQQGNSRSRPGGSTAGTYRRSS